MTLLTGASFGPSIFWGVAQWVECAAVNRAVTGSRPVSPANISRFSSVVERQICNLDVACSNHATGSNHQ